jgi:hypothetical protein
MLPCQIDAENVSQCRIPKCIRQDKGEGGERSLSEVHGILVHTRQLFVLLIDPRIVRPSEAALFTGHLFLAACSTPYILELPCFSRCD